MSKVFGLWSLIFGLQPTAFRNSAFVIRNFRLCAFAALIAFLPASPANLKQKTVPLPPTYRTYKEPYNKVWNAAVRLLFDDLKYTPLAADGEVGYLSTRWKTFKGQNKEKDKRIQVNVNIKKAPDGTLVTVGCIIEEFTPIKDTDQGRWMKIPSDHSCEARFLDQLQSKLKR